MSIDEVLSYWFGSTPWGHAKMWYEMGRDLDPEVRDRFGDTVEAALRGELDGWADSVDGRLALIVVLDQFTRHVFRDTPRFTEGDAQAQRLAQAAFDGEEWRALRSDMASFLFMPLEHAEAVDLQHRAAKELERVAAVHPDLANLSPYLQEHREIIERFGRFPDRNLLLGRPSTPEEQEFLAGTHLAWFERQS